MTTVVTTPSVSSWDVPVPSGQIIHREGPSQAPQNFGSNAPMVRLFCAPTQAFYPDVTTCSQTWVQVVPGTGTGQGPAPQDPQQQQFTPQQYDPQPYNAPQYAPQPQMSAPMYRPAPPVPSRQSGYDINAATASPFVPTTLQSGATSARAATTMSSSTTMTASATLPADVAAKSSASARSRIIPAPRADLPGRPSPVSLLAQTQVD